VYGAVPPVTDRSTEPLPDPKQAGSVTTSFTVICEKDAEATKIDKTVRYVFMFFIMNELGLMY